MTAVWLETRDPARNRRRLYAITVAPTLLGRWAVVRAWGRIGRPGTVREDGFATAEQAASAGAKLTRRKERRGYRAPR